MNEDAVRRLVREAIARQVGTLAPPRPPGAREAGPATCAARPIVAEPDPMAPLRPWQEHVSHGRLLVAPGGPGTPCLIEPAVGCTHCGFCQSYGH
ncbi:MAG: hypothetical protein KJ061_13920 [Vicinamibacteraceae bacterium]|nr:hypothetical protein [Vicinamibacteraceae bacterium]